MDSVNRNSTSLYHNTSVKVKVAELASKSDYRKTACFLKE